MEAEGYWAGGKAEGYWGGGLPVQAEGEAGRPGRAESGLEAGPGLGGPGSGLRLLSGFGAPGSPRAVCG